MALDETKTLTSLDAAKRYLHKLKTDTDDDRLIDALIMQASVMIRREVGCDIVSTIYSKEIYSGDGTEWLYLDNWPITSVSRVSIDRDAAMTATYGGGDASRATVEITDMAVVLRKVVSGVATTNTLTFASDVTITEMADAVTALSGWTGAVVSSFSTYPTADLVIAPARHANDVVVSLEIPEDCEDTYEIYAAEGKLYNKYLWRAGHRNILVDYTAGWDSEALPEPIESACLELTASLYNLSQHDVTLKSEKLGDYQYTIGDRIGAMFSAAGKESTSNMIAMKLGPYKRKNLW